MAIIPGNQFDEKYKKVEVGKGDNYRPCDKKKYDENFDKIFRKKDEKRDTKASQ